MQENEVRMVSGNPPRHSKNADEPVTIDLEAQKIAAAADTVKTSEASAPDAGAPDADKATADLEASIDPEKEPLAEETAGHAAISGEPSQPEMATDPEPVRQKPRGGTTSGLIAAGIFGGLVALLGAGVIQYAGYLPTSSPPQTALDETARLSAEIDGLKQSIASLAAAPNTSDDALDKRVSALETAAKTPAATGQVDTPQVDALNQKVADMATQLEQLRTSLSQTSEERASSGADIIKRLEEAEKKLNEPRQDVAVAQAIAAAALKAAIDRGGPFMAELDTFAGVSPDDPAVADLRNFAETGVPSRAELIRQVPDVATAIVQSVNQADPNQSWSDRLMASAKSLVTVRPVGNIEGENVEAIAARMEDKVKNGDLPGAANEWNDLPSNAKQASAAFKQSLEARIRVEELVGGALSKAISGAGKEG
ncbi:COG4223 family protein [Rhizobium mongolense]|nr:mitofilin family membrane protein [Rhizobium mongolense]